MNIFSICCVAIIGAVLALAIKKTNSDISMLVALATGLIIFFAILSNIAPVLNKLNDLFSATGVSIEYCVILLKVLGICFLCQFTSDTCHDAGQSALATKVELAGKLMITIITLPMLTTIIDTATKLIGG